MTHLPEHTSLIRKILGAGYLQLRLAHLAVDEVPEGESRVTVTVTEGDQRFDAVGTGVGLVDATFAALLDRYAREYESLRSIKLAGFHVAAQLDTKKGQSGADAIGRVTIDVANSEGRRFVFDDASRSVTVSSARAVLAVVEYFVNAERAFLLLSNARRDAIERGRDDLITRYTAELAEVVEVTSYAGVIEKTQRDLG